MKNQCSPLAPVLMKSGLAGSITLDCALPCWAEDDCIGINCCWVKWIPKQVSSFVELIEQFVFAFLPGIPIGRGSEFPACELATGLFLWSGGIKTKGLNTQLNVFIRCSSCGITTFDGSDCPDGGNVKFRRVAIRIQLLSWWQLGQDLIDLLFLDFLWIPRLIEVIFDFIVPCLFPVATTAWNLMKLVIVTTVNCFGLADWQSGVWKQNCHLVEADQWNLVCFL